MKKLNKSNCFFLYGDDPVSANIRKNRIIDSYFHKKAPEVTLFDGSGTFEAYQNALEGQSLFTAETAVVLHNPPFLKRRSEKEDHREESFLERCLAVLVISSSSCGGMGMPCILR